VRRRRYAAAVGKQRISLREIFAFLGKRKPEYEGK
jgi:hypothetical protein